MQSEGLSGARYQISSLELYSIFMRSATRVRSRISRLSHTASPLVLNGEDLKLISIKLDGRKLSKGEYQLDETTLTITELPEKVCSGS